MVLLNEAGERMAGALSDPSGAFRLQAPAAGRYRVHADRTGYEGQSSALLDLQAGDPHPLDLRLTEQAFSLEGVVVRAEQRCQVRPEEGVATQRLWEEIRKALDVSSFVEEARLYRFERDLWVSELDGDRFQLMRELSRVRDTSYGAPYASRSPERLLAEGFARLQGREWVLYAPDAGALLSDAFLEGHCFEVAASPEEGLLGLAFEPVPDRRVPGIAGTLWVDEQTAELRRLEYSYVNVSLGGGPEHAGGLVSFRRLDSGVWFVERWWIRSPAVMAPRAGVGYRVTVVREEGGEVTGVFTPGGRRVDVMSAPALAGVVTDSLRGGPLAGAEVYLSGTQHRARTDDAGRFTIAEVRPGRYAVGFLHPRLDSLGVVLPAVDVEIESEGGAEVELGLPSYETLLAAGCREAGAAGGLALGGVVRDAATGEPLPQAVVTLEAGGRSQEVRTAGDGSYRFCAVEAPGVVTLRATFAGVTGGAQELSLSEGAGALRQDFPLGLTRAADAGVAGAGGSARVEGVLLDEEEEPIGQALVRLAGTEWSTLSGADGRFVFTDVVPGGYEIEIEHVAFGSVRQRLSVEREGVVAVDVIVPREVIALEGVTVRARSRVEAYRRSVGTRVDLMTRSDIEKVVTASHVGDVIQGQFPSVTVQMVARQIDPFDPGGHGERVLCAVPGRLTVTVEAVDPCMLMVVDGIRWDPTESDLQLLHAGDLESVEYIPPNRAGLRYGTGVGTRGVLEIWTRGNGPWVEEDPDRY